MRKDDIEYNEKENEAVEDMTTEELQFELDLLYDEINSTYLQAIIRRIVEIELELERRSNI